jgi:hypothetical protein
MVSFVIRMNMRFEVFMAVKLSVVVFWILMQCGVVGGYQCFIGMY